MTRLEELSANLAIVESEIAPYQPTLIVVTKTYPLSDVEILHKLGVRNFGENRSSEGLEKSAAIDATWHFQGQIQGNKIREIARWADVIHSLDSLSHARKLSGILEGASRDIFIQLSLDGDPSRGGVVESELISFAEEISTFNGINLLGIMCVPPVTSDPESAFSKVSAIHQSFIKAFPESRALSAGMSNDYLIALDHGATHIRVGSKILGSRPPLA